MAKGNKSEIKANVWENKQKKHKLFKSLSLRPLELQCWIYLRIKHTFSYRTEHFSDVFIAITVS